MRSQVQKSDYPSAVPHTVDPELYIAECLDFEDFITQISYDLWGGGDDLFGHFNSAI